jgi:glycosyltransferase involved in cell wall biosynthesis
MQGFLKRGLVMSKSKTVVVIPSYKVTDHIVDVLSKIDGCVDKIIIVDDACPDNTGEFVRQNTNDKRILIIKHEKNKGVGGATITGYKKAIELGATVVVKIDGDGQMDPSLIRNLITPILNGDADYVKGNRFYSLYNLEGMPKIRLFGNSILGFMTKLSSGYWSVTDPTNGFTAIHAFVLRHLNFDNISQRYFFESDVLIHLGDLKAKVLDMPMKAVYGDEISGLQIKDIILYFLTKHMRATLRRIFYSYYLRSFSMASIELPVGLILLFYGISKGISEWARSIESGEVASTGTVILSALPIILGVQFVLSFLSEDMANEATTTMQVFNSEKQEL